MLDEYCKQFLEKSEENYKLYEFLKEHKCFVNWQVVAIFYSALCLAKAYLYKNGAPINTINSHDNIKFLLLNTSSLKNSDVYAHYNRLYSYSRDARYANKNIKPSRLASILEDFEKVKAVLAS